MNVSRRIFLAGAGALTAAKIFFPISVVMLGDGVT